MPDEMLLLTIQHRNRTKERKWLVAMRGKNKHRHTYPPPGA